MMFNKEPYHIVAACTLVSRANGDILLVKTGYRLGWEVPGGQVDIGESPIHGAIRETLEETGVNIQVTALTGIFTNVGEGLIIFAFSGEYMSGKPTPSAETPEVAWVPRDKVIDLIEVPSMIDRVKEMLAYQGNIIHKSYTKNPYHVQSLAKTS